MRDGWMSAFTRYYVNISLNRDKIRMRILAKADYVLISYGVKLTVSVKQKSHLRGMRHDAQISSYIDYA
jgi:hypothetical protein